MTEALRRLLDAVDDMKAGRWQWSITVDGEEMAAGDAPDCATAECEGWHYFSQYKDEGDDVSLHIGPVKEHKP